MVILNPTWCSETLKHLAGACPACRLFLDTGSGPCRVHKDELETALLNRLAELENADDKALIGGRLRALR